MKSSTPLSQIPKGNQIGGSTSVYVGERPTAELMPMLLLLYVNSAIPLSDLVKHLKHVKAYEAPPSLIVSVLFAFFLVF